MSKKTSGTKSRAPESGPAWRDAVLIFGFGALLRLALLTLYPVPYGHDGFGRLYFSDRIFLSHWLPLTQTIVYLAAWLDLSPQGIRAIFAMLAALAPVGFYLLLQRLVPRPIALLGALVFSSNALIIILSLMPYQDVLFLGLLCAGLALLFPVQGKALQGTGASVLFGLACLTRYESWFLIPFLIMMKVGRGTSIPARDFTSKLAALLQSTFYFVWAPMLWFALSTLHWGSWDAFLYQTADGSFYAWEPRFDLGWSLRYAGRMLYWLGLFGSPLLLAGIAGLPSVPSKLRRQPPGLIKLLGLLGLLVLVFFFLVMDREQDTVFRFVLIPLALALILTVFGLERLAEWARPRMRPAARSGLVVLLSAGLCLYASIPIARLNREPQHLAPYRVARFLESQLKSEQRAIVIADRSRKLEDAAPLGYQRIVAQFRGDRSRILSAGLVSDTEPDKLLEFAREENLRFIVLFEDFEPWLPADQFFAGLVALPESKASAVMKSTPATIYQVEIP